MSYFLFFNVACPGRQGSHGEERYGRVHHERDGQEEGDALGLYHCTAAQLY